MAGFSTPRLGRMAGTDKQHPAEIAALAPDIEVERDWRGPAHLNESISRVRAFLERVTPA